MGETHKIKHAKCSSSILGTERDSKARQRRERENRWARDRTEVKQDPQDYLGM